MVGLQAPEGLRKVTGMILGVQAADIFILPCCVGQVSSGFSSKIFYKHTDRTVGAQGVFLVGVPIVRDYKLKGFE